MKDNTELVKNWECFRDINYYNQWAVRNKENKSFHAAIHVGTKEEAEFLVDALNAKDNLTLKLKEAQEFIKGISGNE